MTPGDVCRAEAAQLDHLGLGDAGDLTLLETRVERTDATIRIVTSSSTGFTRLAC